MNTLIAFLTKTAWTMEPPAPYGVFHLLFFCIGTAAALFAAYRLRGVTDRTARALLLSAGVLLLVMELYKQLFSYWIVMRGKYDYWILPFQLCSVPMYLCLLVPLLHPGTLRATLCDFLLGFGAMAGFAAFLQPEGMLHPYVTLTLHSFLWHILQMFIGFFLGFSGRAGWSMRGFLRSALLYLALCGTAYGVNLALWDVSGGNINLFYIGPMPTTTVVFRDIAKACGQFTASLAYMAASCFGALLFYLPFHLYQATRGTSMCAGETEVRP